MPSSSWFHLEHRGTHCVPLSRDPLRGLSRRWSVDRGLKILSFLKCKLCYCLSALIIGCCKMVQKLSSKNLQKVCPKIVKKNSKKFENFLCPNTSNSNYQLNADMLHFCGVFPAKKIASSISQNLFSSLLVSCLQDFFNPHRKQL